MTSLKRWFIVFGLLLASLVSLGSIGFSRLVSPLQDYISVEEHHDASINYEKRLTELTQITSKDPLNLAYVTTEQSQQLMPLSLESGLTGKPVHLDFHGKLIAFAPDGKSVFLADQDNKKLVRLRLDTNEIQNLKCPNDIPTRFVLSPKGQRGYALYPESKKIVHFDLNEDQYQVLACFNETPESLAVNPIESHLYITFKNSNEISTLDLHTGEIGSFINLDHIPEALTFSHDGKKLYVAQDSARLLTAIDINSKEIKTVVLEGASLCCDSKTTAVRVNFKESMAYLSKEKSHEIFRVDLENDNVESAAQLSESIGSIAFYPEQELMASFTVSEGIECLPVKFDATTTTSLQNGEILYHWDFGDGISAVSENPVIEHAYVDSGTYIAVLTAIQTINDVDAHKAIHLEGFNEISSTSIASVGVLALASQNGKISDNLTKAPPIPSTTVGTPSQSTIVFGASVFDNAVVTGTLAGGTPTGTVTFFIGATQIGSAVTLTPGPNQTATASSTTTTPAAVGSYQLSAVYSGDATYATSQDASPTNTVTVTQATSSTNLVTSPNPSLFGQSVNLTATVTIAAASNSIATGTVTFFNGATSLGTVTLVSGAASLPVTNFTVGTKSLTAVYNGTTNFAGSTSNIVSQVVNQGTTTTALTSSVNPTIFGNATLLTATVTVATGAGTPTGTVTFKDGSTTIGTGTITAGVATLSVSNLSVASHTLTAVYNGDTNFTTSTSPAVTQVVNKGTTTTALTSSVNPTTYGQSTTFTATVAVATGVGTPTGFFTFLDGATTLGTVNVTAGSATFAMSTLSVGTHSITAVYSGDNNFLTSTSTAVSQVVNKATPVITLTSDTNPSNYAQSVTFTSTVTAPTVLGLPSGTITFFDGATSLGTVTLAGTGANTSTATLTLTTLSGGLHSITAVYSGDTNFVTVTSSPALSQSVILANTVTVIYTSSANATEFGEPVILQANVTGLVSNPPLPPTSTVTFFDGATAIGTATLTMVSADTATATVTITNFALGTHVLKAQYAGDINYNPSTSATMVQTIVPTNTSSVVTSSSSTTVFGQTVTFTSTVSSQTPGTGSPTGTVQFYSGITPIGTGTLTTSGPNSSTATFSTSSLSIGTHSILTTYLGDGNYTGSTSAHFTQTVVKDATTTTLTSSENPSNFGDSVTITATVGANSPGSGTPTGTVQFFDGTTLLSTQTLNGSGVATYTTIAFVPATHPIKAVYSGDVDFITSTSAILNQVVTSQLNTQTVITSSRNSSPISTAVTYSALVTAITGIPTGTVTFSDGVTVIGTGTIGANGIATVTEPAGMLGTLGLHPITAVYSGDANYITSTAPTFSQYVVPYNVTTVLTVSPNPSEQGQATLTATLSATGPNPIPPFVPPPGTSPADTVTFFENGVAISGPLPVPANGIVTYMPNNLHFGNRNITAVFSGDQTTFSMSTSNTVTQQVQQTDMLATSTVLTSSLSTSFSCQTVTFTAVVSETQGFYIPTGVVTFFDGNDSLGSAILDATGTATLPVSTLTVGTHQIRATYNSDSNYAFSFSNTITQTVVANPTTLTLFSIPNASTSPYGQEFDLVAQLTSPFGIPTGVVTFSNQSGLLQVVDVDATGIATYTETTLNAGNYTFTASYQPLCCAQNCFEASLATIGLTITPVTPHLVLSATPSPGVYGNTIAIQASVTAYFLGTPTGSVTFFAGATNLGTSQIVNGIAMINAAGLPAGTTILRATYNGDTNFIASNFPSLSELLNKAPVVASLLSLSPNPTTFGQPVALTASITSSISVPTGTVKFFSGATLLGSAAVNGDGLATLNVSNLSLGNNTITATYGGDSNFLTATTPSFVQIVNKSNTTTTITSSTPSPSTFNSPVTFNITVAPAYPATGTPTGTVTGFYGSVNLGTATLSNGTASFVTTVLPAGTQTITVQYSGDVDFNSSSGIGTQTVNPATTTIATLTSSNNPSVFGQAVTLSATVSSTAGIPQGVVSFLDGTTVIGVSTLNTSGSTSITTSALSVATHSITVKYTANGNFAASTSSALSQVVNKAATTTSLTSTQTTAVYGQSITFTGTVTPVSPGAGTATGTITFKNGAVTLGTATISNGGTVSFTTSSLVASSTPYSITAVYSGDGNFTTSTSSAISETVNPVSTITSVTSSVNPSVLGQLVTFNVAVTAINNGVVIPNGTVTASYGATIIGTGSLSPTGTISFVTSTLPAGTLPIIFSYAGNSNFSASTSTLDQTVTQATSTTTITSSLNPSDFGQNVNFTVHVASATGTPTGTVSFFDGTNAIGAQTLVNGTAVLSTTTLALGSHNITAVYSGDTSFSTSTSATLVQVVNAAITGTVLTSSVNPSLFGQATVLTATVNVTTGSGTPTGTVTFKNGATVLGTRTLSGNVATLTIATLPVGTDALTAVYSGDTNFTTSTSPVLNQVVNVATTATTLTASPNPSLYGQSVTFNATVSITTGAGTPTGTVVFKDGTTTLGTGTLVGNQASINFSSLSIGSHSITAIYSGDVDFGTSTSPITTQVVNQAVSSTVLSSGTNPSVFGQNVTFSATITDGTGLTPATGTVTFKDGTTTIGTGTISGGVATFSTALLTVGSHNITATYGGDSNYTSSVSQILSQIVNPVTTTTTVSPSVNPSIFGDPVTFTATVAAQVGTNVPDGVVNFNEGTTLIGTGTLSGGVASITTSSLSVGSHSISVVYIGNSNFLSSTSSAFTQTVNDGTTTTAIASSVNPTTFGQSTTFTATVSVATGIGTPTGTVTFCDGANIIGTANLSSGVATFSTSTLQVGTHTIFAIYNGDTSFGSSTSPNLLQVVNQATTVTNILSTTPNPSMFGQTVTFFATTTTPAGEPSGTVSFLDGTTVLGTVPIFNGLAIFDSALLSIGSHTITAVYNGDTNFLTSTSPPVIQVVNQTSITDTTVTTVTSSLNPSQFGQNVTFNISVTPITGSVVPTGIVTIYSGATPLATETLVNGTASYSTATLPAGTSNIVALYSGDSSFSSSTGTIAQVVQPIATVSTLTSSVNPSVSFQPVTFSLTVISTSSGTPTGSVSFFDGATLLGTTTVNNIGVASLTTSSLTAGTHPISAVYNPDPNFITSTDSLSQVVNLSPTTSTILTSSPNPSVQGNSVSFIASVSSTTGNPTGTVSFFDGATLLGTAPIFNGLAIFNTAALTAGTHSITVSYNGDSNFDTSTSAPFSQVVQNPTFPSTTTLVSSLNPSELGAPVTFSATITSPSGSPTGTVAFFDGTTVIGAELIVGGNASLTTSSLSVGTHNIIAVYAGDAHFDSSSSPVVMQVVTQATTTTALSSSVNPTFFGQQTILTANISISTGTGIASGSVNFFDGATLIGTGAVNNSVATVVVSNLSVGAHSLTADYSGDSNYTSSTSSILTQNVIAATTSSTLTTSPNPSLFGQSVALNATIQVVGGAGIPTGTVTFFDGSTNLGTSTLTGGQATFNTSSLSLGSHSLTVVYNGNSNFGTSTSSVVTQVVNQASTSTQLTSGTNPSMFGQAVLLSASVSVGSGTVPATGTVTFKDGSSTIGTGTLSGGIATFSDSTLSVGSHSLTAVYSGDANYASSTSSAVTQIVNPASTQTTVVSSVNPSLIGQSVTFTATVVSLVGSNIPDGVVNFNEGTTLIGTGTLVGGVATISTSLLSEGSHSISVTYVGNADFSTSTSSAFTQTVDAGSTTTSITSSLNPTTFGQSTTFTATVAVTSGTGTPTGIVTFWDGSTQIGSGTLVSGSALFSTSTLPVGTHTIFATYSGDSNFTSSTSSNLSQVVNQANTVTNILSTTPNPSMFGQTVTFFATTTAISGVPSGTVSFLDGSTVIGTVSVFNGLAIFDSALLSIGSHTITAVYNGDTNFLTSTSPPVVQVVNQTSITDTTVTTVTSSLNPSQFGQNVTFNINVAPLTGTTIPTGIVTIYSGSTPLATETLVNGMASYSTATLPAGTSNIVVLYSGDSSFSSSTGTIAQVVQPIATTSTLTSSVNPSVAFQSVTFSLTVTSASAGVPTGSVSFFDGSTFLGTTTVNNIGVASLTTTNLTTGTHPISAVYNPDPNFITSSDSLSQVVNLSPTTSTVLTSSPNPSVQGNSVSFIASISSLTGIPTGTASFFDGATLLGTEPIFNGLSIFNTASLTAGTHSITVTYNGNANFATSTSASFSQVVNNPTFPTTTTLTSSLNPAQLGAAVTFSATVTTASGSPSGTIAFFDGTTLIGAQVIVAGQASLTTSSLTLGTHHITAVYAGDSTFDRSSSAPLTQIITDASTSTALTSSVNPTFLGQQTILTASISISTGTGIATGSVNFFNGATLIGTAAVNNSVATLVVSNLSVGAHSLTAVYSGDTNYTGSTSPILTQNVIAATTASTLTTNPNPSLFGQSVALNASVQVVNGSGIPTGTVTFFDGATNLGTSTLIGGQATLNTSSLSLGTHSLTVEYNGNSNFGTSTSSAVTQVVNQATTSTQLTSGTNPSMFGQPVVLTASISIGSGTVPATGTVTFKDGSVTIGTGTLSGGIATLSDSTLAVGSHNLTAVYGGDANYASSTSAIVTQTVIAVSTQTTVVSSVNPSLVGQSVTFTATVTALVGSNVPDGVVVFNEGTTLLGTGTLVGGVASLSTSSLSVGSHSISVNYVGDSNFSPSNSSAFTQIVSAGNTSTSISSSINPTSVGQSTTFSATVTVTSGTGTPTGIVTFLDGSTQIGSGTLVGNTATFTTASLSVGSHTIQAVYTGDTNFNSSTSPTLTQVVDQANTVTNILSSTPNPSMFGQTVTFFATTTTPAGLPSGTVTFFDGATALGTVPIYDGLAIFATPLLSIGPHTITAHYNGDSNFLGSISPPIIQMVNQTAITDTSVTTLTSSLNPSTFGQAVTFDVTVTPLVGTGTPTGVVTLFSGADPLVTLLLVGGHATYTTSALPAGTLTIVALYSGDSAYSSSSAALGQVVLAIATTTHIVSSVNPSSFQQSVTFTANVTAASGPIPTGSISFFDGVNLLATIPLNGTGFAAFSTASLTTGTHTIEAVYNPTTDYITSMASLSQVVNTASTSSAILTSSPNPSNSGEAVTFFASVSSAGGIPTGTVNFYDGATLIGTEMLFNGLAIFNTSTLSPGSHSITVSYLGSPNFTPSNSLPYIQIVQEPLFNTTTVLSSSLNPAEVGDPVTFTANVSSTSGTPTGTVTFYDGSTAIGTSLLINGVAQLTTSTLPIGHHPIVAIYSGDSAFSSSTSNTLVEVIIASSFPTAPQDFYGCQVINKYLNYDEIVNVLTWSPPAGNVSIVGYEIYRDAALRHFVAFVDNECPFRYEDGNRKRKTTYTYYIVSINRLGNKSPAVSTQVTPLRHSKKGGLEFIDTINEILDF